MATETRPAGTTDVQGEQLALTTTVAALGTPPGRDGRPCVGVVLRCPTAFRFHVNPRVDRCLKTGLAQTTFTDYTEAARDRDTATVVDVSALGTLGGNIYLYIGSRRRFGGISADVGNANVNASVMTVKYYKSDATWADLSATDGTANAGKTLAQDGLITWTMPTDWITTKVDGTDLYWVRITVSAALSGTVDLRELALLGRDANRGYAYANVSVMVPLSGESGAVEAILDAGTATLDLTWCFGNLIQLGA